MKIALITTGGTIGSAVTDGVTNVSEAADIELKKALLSATEGRDDIVIRPAADILSENMTPDVFRLIAGAIRTALNEKKYEGIIVTHGTDTLTFSANALALMFSDTPIPIVLLSANAPLASGGNGRENLAAALTLIRERLCGVSERAGRHGHAHGIRLSGASRHRTPRERAARLRRERFHAAFPSARSLRAGHDGDLHGTRQTALAPCKGACRRTA